MGLAVLNDPPASRASFPTETTHGGILSRWEIITPELAAKYLASQGRNRNVMPNAIEDMVDDMKNGRWRTTHQGIAFCNPEKLVDGQHRLASLVEARITLPFLVTRGLPDDAIQVMDVGRTRRLAQSLKILGDDEVTNNHVACARRMMMGPLSAGPRFTNQALADFMNVHHAAIDAVYRIPSLGKIPASATGAIARAYYHADFKRLERFVLVYLGSSSVRYEPQLGDVTADSLARAVRGYKVKGGNTIPAIIYRKTQAALVAFLAGKDLSRIYEFDGDAFPLPKRPGIAVAK